jgi:hypothetical protein
LRPADPDGGWAAAARWQVCLNAKQYADSDDLVLQFKQEIAALGLKKG